MKAKDIGAFILLAVVLAVVGILLINQFSSSTTRTAEVEVVVPLDAEFDQTAKNILLGQDEQYPIETFSPPVDTAQGFGNTDPFRPAE